MPDPIPFPQHRRAASPSGAEQPADVVRFPTKETALGIPTWCPVPPYVGALVLGLTLAAAAAVCIGMDAVVGGWRIA